MPLGRPFISTLFWPFCCYKQTKITLYTNSSGFRDTEELTLRSNAKVRTTSALEDFETVTDLIACSEAWIVITLELMMVGGLRAMVLQVQVALAFILLSSVR
jgi:hypothetical protein